MSGSVVSELLARYATAGAAPAAAPVGEADRSIWRGRAAWLLQRALDEIEDADDAIPTVGAALQALRIEAGEAPADSLDGYPFPGEAEKPTCTCPPDLRARDGFRSTCPVSEAGLDHEPQARDAEATTALTAHPEHAYTRRQSDRTFAHNHAVLDQPLIAGRFQRAQGDALCRPAAKFWGLYPSNNSPVSCPHCIELADRYGVTLTHPTKETP